MINEKISIRLELSGCKSEDKKDRFIVMKTRQELDNILKKYTDKIAINTTENGIIQITGDQLTANHDDIEFLSKIYDKIVNHSFRFVLPVPFIQCKNKMMLFDEFVMEMK